MTTKLHSFGIAIILVVCCSINLNAQGYSNSDISRIGSDRDSSSSSSNLTVRSSSNTRDNDVSIIFVGQSDSRSLEDRKPSSNMQRITKEGHEASFRDVNLQTYYYIHTSDGSKTFNFGSHSNGFVYLLTLRNVDHGALRNIRSDRSSDYRWTDANTNRRYGSDRWRSGCGSGRYKGLAYVNEEIRSYNKGLQIAAVMYDDNPENIEIYDGRTSNTKIMTVLDDWTRGDDAMAIGMKTTDGSRTDELHFRGDKCVGGNGENVLATFTLKPGSGGGSNPPPPTNNWVINNCDSRSGWSGSSSNTLSISSNYREGSGSLKSVGSGTDDFRRSFSAIDARGATALEFWYYVSDVSDLRSSDQVELGSGSRADTNEYNWEISRSTLNDGWNYIRLRFSDARTTGGSPDKSRLNWFRLYRSKSRTVTSRIDNIKLTGNTSRTAISIEENTSSLHKVYPNPSRTGELNLVLNLDQGDSSAIISVKNVLGQNVYTNQMNDLQAGINQRSLQLPLTPAMYFVEIKTNKKRQIIKWLIAN